VVAVHHLDAGAARLWEAFGLASVAGGRHPAWGTGNRIVPLSEAYVELLAVADPAVAATTSIGRWIEEASRDGDRLVAWCVATDDVDAVADRLGLAVTPGSRTLPDGRTVAWRSAGFDAVRDRPDRPFFIRWDVPPELHPGRAQAGHRVRPQGISRIDVTGDPRDLREWLGGADLPVHVTDGAPGILAVAIATDGDELVLR
jgi:Glyoxalase-like domain